VEISKLLLFAYLLNFFRKVFEGQLNFFKYCRLSNLLGKRELNQESEFETDVTPFLEVRSYSSEIFSNLNFQIFSAGAVSFPPKLAFLKFS
jgi:hypothetical protein